MARERAEEIARKKHYYPWMYRTVLADWRSLEELFRALNRSDLAHTDESLRSS